MFRRWIWAAITALALLTATGASGLVADELGLEVTQLVFACDEPSGSGGC